MQQLRKDMPKAEGFLLVNKPAGFTSYDAIRYIKKMLGNSIKIGHSGTLDPFATGLLIIAIGKKIYSATIYINGLV